MNALDEVIDYLHKKIDKTNLNNPKSNIGAKLVKSSPVWKEKLDTMVLRAFQVIQMRFTRSNFTTQPGETGLTYVSTSVAKAVGPLIRRHPLTPQDQLAVGDLIIEGFVYHGFAEIETPPRFSREGYKLCVCPKWEELHMTREQVKRVIIASYAEPIPTISVPIQSIHGDNHQIHKLHQHVFDSEAAYVKAIDNLQSVAWCINERVLDTYLKTPIPYRDPDTLTKREQTQETSKRMERRFVIEKAKALNEEDKFYQAFDVDYRGRIYNIEPFLNYQSNDLAKGLLLFKEAKPITEEGEFWLAVHTAVSYNETFSINEIPEWCEVDYATYLREEGLEDISVDKMTLKDRAQWTYQNANRIIEWAETDSIQRDAEKPIVFLACCYEWDIVEKIGLTCLPVAIDGSNNGWQHLGAISKDVQTGELVGLVPVKIQKDFYVQTAKKLIDLTTAEKQANILESMPMKHIRKGISKRGSMTRAYSAGSNKISLNMYDDCESEKFHKKYNIKLADCKYFAKKLVDAIEVVCPGPLQTMKYLQDLALYEIGKYEAGGPGGSKRYIEVRNRRRELLREPEKTDEDLEEINSLSKELEEYSFGLTYGNGADYITWTTPSGFVAQYEKFTTSELKVRARINGKQIKHVLSAPTNRTDTHGFMCGISPNYIHSMDAAHMALVVAEWDGDFGAVHDSFSTHASDVGNLLKLTKKVFINMYDHDNYFNTIRQQITGGNDDIVQPELGELNIKEIEDSDYFFA